VRQFAIQTSLREFRIATDLSFLEELQAFVNGLKDRFDPRRELEAWRNLLEEL
jgi:hypothetical protein